MKILMAIAARWIDGLEMAVLVTAAAIDLAVLARSLKTAQPFMVKRLNAPMLKIGMATITGRVRKLIAVNVGMTECTFSLSIVFQLTARRMTAIARLLGMASTE